MIDSYRKALDSAITAMLREAMEHSEALDHLVDQINQLVALRVRLAESRGEDQDGDEEVVKSESSGLDRLTQRESEVLDHLVRGRSNRQIARSLSISERTVKNHLHGIFTKLGVTDRTSAAITALDESRES